MKRTKLFLTVVAMMSAVSITGCSAKVTIENPEAAGAPTVTVETGKAENTGTNTQSTAVAEKQTVTEKQPTIEKQSVGEQQTVIENQPTIDETLYEDIFVNGTEDWNYVLQENEEFAYSFELKYDEATYQQYATVVCHGDKGSYWEYETDKYEVGQSSNLEVVEATPYCLYINEGGTLTALNIADGKVLWQNSDYQGSGSIGAFDERDNLYVTAYEGPALMIIDPNGNTLCKVGQFADYFWPYDMYIEDDMLTIHFDSEDNATVTMDINDYSYSVNS